MRGIDLIEKNVSAAIYQLLLPFPIQPGSEQKIISLLKENGFNAFHLQHMQNTAECDGPFHGIHPYLKTGFSPLTNKILFPSNDYEKGFHMYTKALSLKGCIIKNKIKIPFKIYSIDIILCPFDIGILSIKTEITFPENLPLSVAIEFGSCFQIFSSRNIPKQLKMECGGKIFVDMDTFLFTLLVPEGMKNFLHQIPENEPGTHESVYLGLEGIYVQSFLKFQKGETIDITDVYRTGNLCGLTDNGNPYITANNMDYIEQKIKGQSYERFAPNTFYYVDEDCFTCLTKEDGSGFDQLLSQFFTEHYLLLVINLFHRMVLLKCLEDYSRIKIKQDSQQIRKLLFSLNSFTSNYFYPVLPANSINKELFELFKKAFSINVLYNDSKEMIFSLFKDEENTVTRKDSFLLLILTMYTVVCGIFSMNLFTDDLKGKIKWHHLFHYNFFEYLAVCIVFSGMIVTMILGIQHFFQSLKVRKEKKKWLQQTVVSSKKQ